MIKSKTKQIYIFKINHPFDFINKMFFKNELYRDDSFNNNYKIKKFIGSDWSIKDSGFMFSDLNETTLVFNLINVEENDFIRINIYKITYLNENKCNNDIYFFLSLIKNTADNTSIIELRLKYESEMALEELEKYIKISYIKKITIREICLKLNLLFNEGLNKLNDFVIINHSFIINLLY
jgi:hypothetical protein